MQKFFFNFYSENTKDKKQGKVRRLFEKYGCPGLGLIGTLFMGQPFVMILGMIVVNAKQPTAMGKHRNGNLECGINYCRDLWAEAF